MDGSAHYPQDKLLSILTPLLSSTPVEYIKEAWQSIENLRLPNQWNWEWIVQQDGPGDLGDTLAEITGGDQQVSFARGDQDNPLGDAITRTAAFVRSRGALIISLDADDYFIAGGVEKQIEAAENHPECVWFSGQSRRVIEGKEQPRPCPLTPGFIAPGEVRKLWTEIRPQFPILATPIMIRAGYLWLFGGWPALERATDISLLFAISEAYPGWLTAVDFYAYRKWSGQMTWERWQERQTSAVNEDVAMDTTTAVVRAHRQRWSEVWAEKSDR